MHYVYMINLDLFSFSSAQIKLYVSKITSTKTQMPYDYYSLPYCKPNKQGLQSENLGEVLSGDRIENSIYKVPTFLLCGHFVFLTDQCNICSYRWM